MPILAPYRAYGFNGTISAQPGCKLALITGYSRAAATRYLMLFNTNAPAPGATPRNAWPVPAGAPFSFASSALGPAFGSQCFWAVSDTAPTFTQSADSFWVYAEGDA